MTESQLTAIIDSLSNAKAGSIAQLAARAIMENMAESTGATLSGSNLQTMGRSKSFF